jgi:hypothetical protein
VSGAGASARALARVTALVAVAFASACGGGGASAADARYPRRAEGCDVTVFHGMPDGPTDNIGPVEATCAEEVAEADCVRTLKDAVCKLGGDVVWGVDEPKKYADKLMWSGRAAHTRVRASGGTNGGGDNGGGGDAGARGR